MPKGNQQRGEWGLWWMSTAGSRGMCISGRLSVRGGERIQGYWASIDPVATGLELASVYWPWWPCRSGVMFRRFIEGADEKLPWLAETKTNLSVHIVGMELNLNGLGYSWLVWMFKTYVPLMLLQPGVNRMACLPNVDLAALTRDSVYTQCP
jgi:hypothetical protein